MKLERSKNAKRNIIYGFINKMITILLPFMSRTIIIHILGAEYLGLGSLFSSILQVLSLTELGFGSAMVYSMYKPIAENDNEVLCALLALYRKIYRIIGCVVFGLGIIILPFLPYLINGSHPRDINIYILYLMYLANSVASYCLFAYRSSLLNAYQRVDIVNNISSGVNIVMYVLQIVILIFTKNYYFYALMIVVSTVFINILTAYNSYKLYPHINVRNVGTVSKEIKKEIKIKVKGLMLNKVCQVSRNAFDSIFVSLFLGLTQTAIYNNYYYIMNAVTAMLAVVSPAILGGVGNSIVTESVEKNYHDMNKINFIYMWLSGVCTVSLLCLYQPFTELFFGKELLFPMSVVVLFCIYFYTLKMGDIRSVYVHANGLWWENRYRSVVEAIANIVLNFVLGKYFGVFGIIIATLLSLFVINFLWGSGIIFKYYFKNISIYEYYRLNAIYAIATFAVCIICYCFCTFLQANLIWKLIYRVLICIFLSNFLFWLCFRKTKQYSVSIPWIYKTLFRK